MVVVALRFSNLKPATTRLYGRMTDDARRESTHTGQTAEKQRAVIGMVAWQDAFENGGLQGGLGCLVLGEGQDPAG